MNDDSMSDAVKAAGFAAARKAHDDAEKRRKQQDELHRLAQDPMNVRLAAIDLAQRAAAGKQWTPEQYQAATEFYYGFITAKTTKPRKR